MSAPSRSTRPDWLAPETEWRTFPQTGIGHTRIRFPSIASTNDFAKLAPFTPDDSGIVILADHQTAGRGQYGRTWASRSGSSVLMSVVLYPPARIARPVILTAWVAVAVSRAVQELTNRQPRIKWPNDLLVDEKKLCGILIEVVNVAGALRVVAGIGLNIGQQPADFAEAGLPDATSVSILAPTSASITRDTAVETVIGALQRSYASLNRDELQMLETEWSIRTGLPGRSVTLGLTDGSALEGTLRTMRFERIELETLTGVRTLAPELIRSIAFS